MKVVAAVVALVAAVVCAAPGAEAQSGLYCEPDDCYTLLGLDRYDSPSTKDIKKAYRALSRDLHPDRNRNDPAAASKFSKVARAYEILVDDESRNEYHYARDHPEDVMGNSYRYYSRVYAPKADPRLVVVAIVAGLSALQWTLQLLMFKNGKRYLQKYHPKFQKEVKRIARERLDASRAEAAEPSMGGAAAAAAAKRRKRDKKDRKTAQQDDLARLAELEKEVAAELIEEVQVEGGYRAPQVGDLLFVKLLQTPYTVPKALAFYGGWFYRRSVSRVPLERWEKLYLLTTELSRSEAALVDEFGQEGLERLIETECWQRDNYLKFQEEQFRQSNPERYKQYMRWKKSERSSG